LLKEELRLLYHLPDPALAEAHLTAWLAWASRSKLKPFIRLARTLRARRDGILAAIRLGLSNGRMEGLNSKVRLLARSTRPHEPEQARVGLCPGVEVPELLAIPSLEVRLIRRRPIAGRNAIQPITHIPQSVSPSSTTSIPVSTWHRTTSCTAPRNSCTTSGAHSPCSAIACDSSTGRCKAPTCVVRILSMLRSITPPAG